jgi:hypothetical protein
VNDFDRQVRNILHLKEGTQTVLLSNEHNGYAVFGSCLDGTFNLNRRRLVAAHRVYRDFDLGHEELLLSGLDNFPFLVETAMRTRAMRHP